MSAVAVPDATAHPGPLTGHTGISTRNGVANSTKSMLARAIHDKRDNKSLLLQKSLTHGT